MSDDKGPLAISRRVVIAAASAAPGVSGAGGGALTDPAVARCAEWLALDAEIDRLGVALRVMIHQQGDGYDLFKATREELRTARCPNCGAPACKR
ncbi:MAG: hypothetical protein B7Z12_18350 [Caulobacter vibrioides]|uniref:Uncharacterized protein n=1 Tax=Caulobacter vibrioides TaxID=155892 RepID=A0A258CVA5_CAUVI|nr:MAG: hypothetical protein B7Z12_18350 [Caulobacter vibrioides]